MASRYDVVFSGHVQGVFFRATACEIARRHAVSGWVRNERDGTVRCVVEGEEPELDRFLDALTDAKRDNIDQVQVERSASAGELAGFEIRR